MVRSMTESSAAGAGPRASLAASPKRTALGRAGVGDRPSGCYDSARWPARRPPTEPPPSPTYRLTEDQLALRDAVRVLADERIAPRAAEIDRTAEFPWDVKELLASTTSSACRSPRSTAASAASS